MCVYWQKESNTQYFFSVYDNIMSEKCDISHITVFVHNVYTFTVHNTCILAIAAS